MFKPRRVAIIGGSGLMGQWFSKFFASQGCIVTITGRRYAKCLKIAKRLKVKAEKSNTDAVKGADLVIISVMMRNFESTIKGISKDLVPGQIVVDITSVKVAPVNVMHRYLKGVLVLGTHPMFGPSASAKGQNFILTPTNAKEKSFAKEFSRYLHSMGVNPVVMAPGKHDQMISAMLSLTHFVGFVTGDTWRELRIHKFMKTTSTSFRFLKSFVQSIVDSSPELYSYLQVGVPNAYTIEKLFVKKSKEWSQLTRSKNEKKLERRMSALAKYVSKLG